MMPRINPKQMASMMKQMGIKNEDVSAKRVIIETDNENIIIEDPKVMKVEMQGNTSYQISGNEKVEQKESFTDEDISIVMQKASTTKEEAIEALKESEGDIAEAIMALQS